MTLTLENPRSILHAVIPMGAGTAQIESLISYFCRVAVSHSTSVTALARLVAREMGEEFQEDFDWGARSISCSGKAARVWSGGLSALTGVGHLDALTLLPWRDVFTAQRLLHIGTARWCPACLCEDRVQGLQPYFRLAWDVKAVTACDRHAIRLTQTCPCCNRIDVRHNAAYVIPGFCTRCGAFLGEHVESIPATPEACWIAEQVGGLLRAQSLMSHPALLAPFQAAITHIVTEMAGGKPSVFAKRVGLAKSTVHCWVHGKTACTLEAALQVSAETGLSLARLAMGDFDGWTPPSVPSQLNLDLELGTRQQKIAPRFQDWVEIRQKLLEFAQQPEPISLTEAARRLGVDRSHVYSHANREARIVSARWKQHVKACADESRRRIRQRIELACLELRREGRAFNLRELQTKIPKEELDTASHLFEMLREIREGLGSSQ